LDSTYGGRLNSVLLESDGQLVNPRRCSSAQGNLKLRGQGQPVLPRHLSSDEVDQEQDSRQRQSMDICVDDGSEVSQGRQEFEGELIIDVERNYNIISTKRRIWELRLSHLIQCEGR